jgi:hypothetical protein
MDDDGDGDGDGAIGDACGYRYLRWSFVGSGFDMSCGWRVRYTFMAFGFRIDRCQRADFLWIFPMGLANLAILLMKRDSPRSFR